ncbi:hypothetical protein KR767_04265 [Luteibacter anthropi]|uniref:hypothetical protein n=1 Tax=Luteibacter anthropi TaxID=564369 RepID=UPI00203298E2|nr:hypothetical protein [Luteibacter anthropi]URX63292.1 hypothetical protein KR767_04265 [Luteibacter anthropi]
MEHTTDKTSIASVMNNGTTPGFPPLRCIRLSKTVMGAVRSALMRMFLSLIGNTLCLVGSYALGGVLWYVITVVLTLIFGQLFGQSWSLVNWMRDRVRIARLKEPMQ